MNEEFSFLNEKIKEKPFYKKKPVRIILATTGLAVLFAIVFSIVFVHLHPWLAAKREGIKNIEIPQDTEEDALQPPAENTEPEPGPIIVDQEIALEDYGMLFAKFRGLAKDVEKSLVTVTAVSSDVDWFNEAYENHGQTSGMIIGDNGVELLILTEYAEVEACDDISVTFADHASAGAVLKKYDKASGLAVISVNLSDISEKTNGKIARAALGNSVHLGAGTPVLALGRADGSENSMKIGMITSVHKSQSMIDAEYKIFVTDMIKNADADGVLVNLNGEIVGILQEAHVPGNVHNVLTAYAISDIKSLIERLSNNQDITYLGIKGVSVTDEAKRSGIPGGVYVTKVEMDSPAMRGGIQSGDVLQALNGQKLEGMAGLSAVLQRLSDKQNISLEGRRLTGEGYKKVSYQTALSVLE